MQQCLTYKPIVLQICNITFFKLQHQISLLQQLIQIPMQSLNFDEVIHNYYKNQLQGFSTFQYAYDKDVKQVVGIADKGNSLFKFSFKIQPTGLNQIMMGTHHLMKGYKADNYTPQFIHYWDFSDIINATNEGDFKDHFDKKLWKFQSLQIEKITSDGPGKLIHANAIVILQQQNSIAPGIYAQVQLQVLKI